jgi:branched-chain amino acid transport system substrate-binding protein
MRSERRWILNGLLFAVLLTVLAFVGVGCVSAATTHYVVPGGSIQAAVTAANPGDTIIVHDGIYTENIAVNKRLTIRSKNGSANCFVNALNSNDHVFAIFADYVNISGFTITGVTGYLKSGVYLWSADYCNISNNRILNSGTHECGIYLGSSSSHNLINNNYVSNNDEYGIYIESGNSYNEIANNIIINVSEGVSFHSSCSNNNVTNNTIINDGSDGRAIVLNGGSSNNRITRNTMTSNMYGVSFNDGCGNNNTIYLNNFIDSTINHVFTGCGALTNIWNSPEKINYTYNGTAYTNYMGNYWDNYTDVDTNNDGIWDTSYTTPDTNSDGYPLVESWENYFEPPEPPSLPFTYTGDVLPSADGWSIIWYEDYESTSAQIEGGVLHITDSSSAGGSGLSYYRAWPSSPDCINVAEFDVKVVSCSGILSVYIGTNDDDYNMIYNLFPDRIQSRYAITYNDSSKDWYLGDVYYFDTTSQFNTYKAVIDDGIAKLYLNGELVLEQPAGTGVYREDWPTSLNYSSGVEFGVAGSPTTGEAYFDEVRAYALHIFDTGTPTNPYPSISGRHNGTITPSCNLTVSKLYTYPCLSTGGHTEYVKIWNSTDWNVTATWTGYQGDWHNLTFNNSFTLYANETYNYTIRTGSYPQIIHEQSKDVTGGTIMCTEFFDANGEKHHDWIPAIRLEAEVITIGIVAPLTGASSATGNEMWQSALLAADEINTLGGVNVNGVPMKIRLVQGNTESTPEGGVNAVTKLITEDKVDLIVGGFSSGVTYADSVVAAAHIVPFIITGASSPALTRRTDINTSYLFHHSPTTDDFPNSTLLFVDEIVKPAIYVRFNYSEERPLRLAVLYQNSAYGQGVYDGINKTIERYNLSMEVVAAEKFNIGETNYTSVLTIINATEPDVVYPAAFVNEQSQIITQGRRDVGLNTTYLSVEVNDESSYYTEVGSCGVYSIQESRFSPYAIPLGPIHSAVVKFKGDYEARWGIAPGMMAASTYEGVYIAAEAIENAGTQDKKEVRDALAELEMPQIVELMKDGVITFSPDYRESKFELYMQQLIWNDTAGETRPKIVWPESVNETAFVLPDWYEPGSP